MGGETTKGMNKALKKNLASVLLLIFIGNLIAFVMNPAFVTSPKMWLENCLFSIGLGWPMMKFNGLIIRKYGNRIKWESHPAKRIVATLGVVIVLAIILTFLINYIFIFHFSISSFPAFFKTTLTLLLIEVLIIVYVFSLFTGIEFFQMWKAGLIRQESLQRKAVELQMEALKNQVNPHFLFNSLNTLTSLVHKDPDKAVQFIIQLSDIYRYVLENRNKATVDWRTEKIFVENYLQLQQIRFANNIIVHVDTGDNDNFQVVPLSVQMLVENAIKHNIITSDNPLDISIYMHDGCLVVRNKLQLKSSVEYSENVGLDNISQQYGILAHREIGISREDGYFTVSLPEIHEQVS
jgi:sensor histidine kinase YesM